LIRLLRVAIDDLGEHVGEITVRVRRRRSTVHSAHVGSRSRFATLGIRFTAAGFISITASWERAIYLLCSSGARRRRLVGELVVGPDRCAVMSLARHTSMYVAQADERFCAISSSIVVSRKAPRVIPDIAQEQQNVQFAEAHNFSAPDISIGQAMCFTGLRALDAAHRARLAEGEAHRVPPRISCVRGRGAPLSAADARFLAPFI
jgi:hypothetical protein